MRFAFSALLMASLTQAAFACGICISVQGNPLALPHPRAIEVAVATRAALDTNELRPPTTSATWNVREKPQGRLLLTAWAQNRRIDPHALISLHVIFVDTSEAAVIIGRGGQLVVTQQTDLGDCVVVTSSHALRAILSGELRLVDAMRRGLVIVEGNKSLASMLES